MSNTEHRSAPTGIVHHTAIGVEAAHPRTKAHVYLSTPNVILTSHAAGSFVSVAVNGTPAELLALFGPVVDTLRQHVDTEVAS